MPRLLNNPARWHLRAQEAQFLAAQLEDPVAKAATLRIAEEYERLAARAAQRSGESEVDPASAVCNVRVEMWLAMAPPKPTAEIKEGWLFECPICKAIVQIAET